MIIDFEKTIHFHAEVDDKQFQNEFGNITEDVIIGYCESIDSADEETCFVYSDELKNLSWEDSSNKKHEISESEYKRYKEDRERAEVCYECTGYGDDYDSEGNCRCEGCPFNYSKSIDNKCDSIKINPQEFLKKFCDRIKSYYLTRTMNYESSVKKTKTLLKETKFSFLEIYSKNRIFLFAENPIVFIKDNKMWNYLQSWVNDEYNSFMAIGLYKMNNLEDSEEIYSIHDMSDYLE